MICQNTKERTSSKYLFINIKKNMYLKEIFQIVTQVLKKIIK